MEVTVKEELERRMRQFLVHSYIYYELSNNVLSDHNYDFLCKRMVYLMKEYPEIAIECKYYDICKEADASGSGFYIQDYPPEMITMAFRVLWWDKKDKNPEFDETFSYFISRWGRKIERRP